MRLAPWAKLGGRVEEIAEKMVERGFLQIRPRAFARGERTEAQGTIDRSASPLLVEGVL